MTQWMDLGSIMLSEISQTEKDKYCIFSLKGGSFKWIYFVKYTKTRREKERKGKERKEKRKRSVIMVEGIDSSSPKCRPDTKYNGCSRLSNIPRVIFECIYTFKPI